MRSDLGWAGELAVVVAVYNSAPSLQELTGRLLAYWQERGMTVHLVLVDDGSTDESWRELCRLAKGNPSILAVRLRRNFGQQNALLCGLQLARGHRYLITMDDDLQHPPELGGALYDRIKEGYDLVYAVPQIRRRPLYRRIGAALRDGLFALCTHKPKGVKVSAYRIMTGALAEKICAGAREFVYLSAASFLHRPKVDNLSFSQPPRRYGRSGYTLRRLAGLYWKLFVYYTAPGSLFRPRERGVPSEIESRMGGWTCDE